MAVTVSQKADFTVLECDGELNIFYVREFFDSFSEVLRTAPDKLIVDLTALQDFDTSGLQLLIWLKSTLANEPDALTITAGNNHLVTSLLTLYQYNHALDFVTDEEAGDD